MAFTKTPAAGSAIAIMIGTTYTNINGVEGLPEFGPSKAEYENTAINDTAKTFGTDLPDPGETTLAGSWDMTDAGQLQMMNSAVNVASTDQFKQFFKSGATATFNGKVMSFRTSAQKGQDEKFSARIKLTGAVTYTDHS